MTAPPKSVVFETAPPSFVFQQSFFQATVKLVDAHKHKVTGHARPLQVTLRYHDTYDVVPDQSLLVVDAHATAIHAASGTCELRVLLTQLTAAHDGRAFCLEIRALDGDLESAFSSPIHVVKEKLQIVQHPPDVWFKDEGGREKCMVVTLVVEPAPGARIEERVVPLQLRLLYESGTAVLNQSILKLFPDMRPNMSRGRVAISFRIDDVSKNHQGQSFVLEIAPEKQETSQMFQDIAPARTTVIAIRSKRNKRKLNGLTPRNGVATPTVGGSASGSHGSHGTGSGTPVAGAGSSMGMNMHTTPRAPGMPPMMASSPTHAGSGGMNGHGVAPPSQRPRHIGGTMMTTTGTPLAHNNQYVLTPHPSAARMGHMMMAAPPPPSGTTQTWSSHIQQPPHAVSTPMGVAGPTAMTVEWKLAGFEIHPDGSPNVSRPIYRCTHCRRLVDVEMMNHGHELHASQCMFVPGGAYRSQHMHTAASTPQSQHHPQQQQSQYYSNVTPRAAYPPDRTTTPRAQAAVSTPMNAPEPMAAPTAAHYIPDSDAMPHHATGVSPKTLAQSLAPPSGHRPVLTISPFMNKIVTNETLGDSQQQPSSQSQSQSSQSSSPDDPRGDGNLFASHAFRNQMDLSDMPSPTTEEKMLFLNKPLDTKMEPEQHEQQPTYLVDNPQSSLEPEDQSLIVSVGSNSLYNEMTSMGINVEGIFTKSGSSMLDPGHPMADSDFTDLSSGLTEEDQVFYILARMYANPQSGKLGLPAFDQFQRMLGFYSESQDDMQTQVVFHSLHEVGLPESEQLELTTQFQSELQQDADVVHSLPKYQHNLVLLREDALMYYWSQSLQSLT